MEAVYFTLAAIVLYFVSDRILERIEVARGTRLEHRSLVFFGILLGLALMTAEAFAPSFGVLGIGGTAAFVIGSIMLLETDAPGFGISWTLIGSIAAVSAGFFILMMMMLVRSRSRPVVSGPEEMIGSTGQVIDWEGHAGTVRVHGEVWNARAARALETGRAVRVEKIDGLTLVVQPNPKRR